MQLDSQRVAEYRSYKGLTYMTILNAGHMVRTTSHSFFETSLLYRGVLTPRLCRRPMLPQVPLDQPHVALSMLDDFLFHGAITSPAEPSV